MLTPDSRTFFPLEAGLTYLNHGGYGVTPKSVLDAKKRVLDEIEGNPVSFFSQRIGIEWHKVAENIGDRFSLKPGSVAIVDNVTDGIQAVLRSLSLKEGDEILATSLGYGAITMAVEHIAKKQGAIVKITDLRFPDPAPEQCIEAVAKALTSQTKLVILDHITSSTALLLPLKEMIDVCRQRDVRVLVDGAHAPGQIALDIPGLQADWYVGNLHKWYFVPRSCGILWAASGREKDLMPNVTSWDIHNPFPSNFAWTGTRDPSSWMSISAAFDFMDRFGEKEVCAHNHKLIREVVGLLANMWNVKRTTPDTMTAAMTLVPTPDGLSYPANDEGMLRLELDLKDKHGIVVKPAIAHEGRIWLRLTAQIYNGTEDYRKLGRAVLGLC